MDDVAAAIMGDAVVEPISGGFDTTRVAAAQRRARERVLVLLGTIASV
jgi:hypothetical protein